MLAEGLPHRSLWQRHRSVMGNLWLAEGHIHRVLQYKVNMAFDQIVINTLQTCGDAAGYDEFGRWPRTGVDALCNS